MTKSYKLFKGSNWSNVWVPENGNRPNEWKEFCRAFRSDLMKFFKAVGATEAKFHNMYFEISVFVKAKNGQIWYIHLSDVRYCDAEMYFRTATSYTDYTGGSNNWATLKDLEDKLRPYFLRN